MVVALEVEVAVPAGVSLAMETGQNGAVVLIMGMVTGCMGGLMRDVVCNEVPLGLKQGGGEIGGAEGADTDQRCVGSARAAA